MKSRHYFAYAALLLLVAISLTYRGRQIVDRTDRLMHGDERVLPPFNIDSSGMSIVSVRPEAGSAGLRAGDVITAVDGTSVGSANDLVRAIHSHKPGDHIRLTWSRGGQSQSVTATLVPTGG